MIEPSTLQPLNHFLKMPKLAVPMSFRIRSEPLIDYRHSQILTSSDHVNKLQHISQKLVSIEEEKIAKKTQRELIRAKMAQVILAIAKEERILE